MASQFAVRFALIVFAIVELRGAIQGSDFTTTTKTGLLAAAISMALGLFVGTVAARAVEESAKREFESRVTGEPESQSVAAASTATAN